MDMTQRSMGRVSPAVTRSKLALELAAELVGMDGWPHLRAQVLLKTQDFDPSGFSLYGSGQPDGIEQVARGESQLAIINPSAVLTMAHRGTGFFERALDVRAITVLPSYDQIAFAVTEATGLRSLADVASQRYPLRVSIRGPRENSVPQLANVVFRAYGFTLDDIDAWGGKVTYDRRLPAGRLEQIESGAADALFDEAVHQWVDRAAGLGMRFFDVDDDTMRQLGELGLRRGVVAQAVHPRLPADVQSVDFSGFPLFTRADVPEAEIRAVCAALEARRDRIPWEGQGPMPLDQMCRDTTEGPLDVPLHPAAQAYWREAGYL